MKKPCIVVLSTISMCLSCTDPELTVNERLTDGSWKMTSLTIDPAIEVSGTLITNYYNQLQDYDKDNTIAFLNDNTYTVDEGATKEFPSDPQTKQGHWLLSENEDMLTAWISADTIVYGISSITEMAMILAYSERDSATQINYTLTAGFAKQ